MASTSIITLNDSPANFVSRYQQIETEQGKSSLHNYGFNSRFSGDQVTQTSNRLVLRILKDCTSDKQGIHPRIFCRRWFGLEQTQENGKPRYREEQILAMEAEYGYREKCINLIARLLKIKPNTIQRWGKGVEFNRISADKRAQYETYLGYIDTIRFMTVSCAKFDPELLISFARSLSIE